VKLLFDENLPPRLPKAFATLFPGSQHVHSVGLGSVRDVDLWEYARDHSFILVTKDSDFHERSVIFGYPPKVVWIRRGNCSAGAIEQMLRAHASDIENLASDPDASFLILI
jgi:predicted nuclease of predicted toxin-antitoxin system